MHRFHGCVCLTEEGTVCQGAVTASSFLVKAHCETQETAPFHLQGSTKRVKDSLLAVSHKTALHLTRHSGTSLHVANPMRCQSEIGVLAKCGVHTSKAWYESVTQKFKIMQKKRNLFFIETGQCNADAVGSGRYSQCCAKTATTDTTEEEACQEVKEEAHFIAYPVC